MQAKRIVKLVNAVGKVVNNDPEIGDKLKARGGTRVLGAHSGCPRGPEGYLLKGFSIRPLGRLKALVWCEKRSRGAARSFVCCLSADNPYVSVSAQVLFVPNYNVSVAEKIIPVRVADIR